MDTCTVELSESERRSGWKPLASVLGDAAAAFGCVNRVEELVKQIPYTERTCVWDKARISRILENAKYTGGEEFEAIIDESAYEEAAAVKSARRWNQAVEESEGIRQLRDHIRCGNCGAPMLRHINSKRAVRESWTCSSAACGLRVRISDGELLPKVTLLMNRIIENADLLLPHETARHTASPAVQALQQQITNEMSREQPDEQRIVDLLREIAGQLYRQTNAKTQIAAQIARKRAALMHPQDEYHCRYQSLDKWLRYPYQCRSTTEGSPYHPSHI